MSPQLLWTIAGLILTVLTLGGVTISSYQSQDSAKVKLVASEVANLATASKLWLANDATTNGSYSGITNVAVSPYIPDLITSGGTAVSLVDAQNNGSPPVYTLANAGNNLIIEVAFSDMNPAFGLSLLTALTNKVCTPDFQPVPIPRLTYTCVP